jgi:Domain of unknown function (DUF4832)
MRRDLLWPGTAAARTDKVDCIPLYRPLAYNGDQGEVAMHWFLVLCGILAITLQARGAVTEWVIVQPAESQEILSNPHMGWETFHTPADQDRNLPSWIPSRVYYVRWGWRDLEPKPGELNTTLLDKTLAQAHHAGQSLAFRVMCCASGPKEQYHPEWLKQVGGRVYQGDYEKTPVEVPDLDDPTVLEYHLKLIRALGQRYDGHPDLDHVDLGSVGWWGEWHMSGSSTAKMPTPETCRKIVDTYFESFKKTPLLMLIGGGEQLRYAAGRGAGWRADCLGDLGGFSSTWSHMKKGYPQWVQEGNLEETWKHAPVAYESGWDARYWVKEKWPLRYIFNYALATHASYLNNKSAPLPQDPNVRPEVERFLKRLGYRFVLREASYSADVAPGASLTIESSWQNLGSAPCYRPYRLAWRLKAGTQEFITADVPVNGWMPGDMPVFTAEFLKDPQDLPAGPLVEQRSTIHVPAELAGVECELAVAIVGEKDSTPAIRLAIGGRGEDGWYRLGTVHVASVK